MSTEASSTWMKDDSSNTLIFPEGGNSFHYQVGLYCMTVIPGKPLRNFYVVGYLSGDPRYWCCDEPLEIVAQEQSTAHQVWTSQCMNPPPTSPPSPPPSPPPLLPYALGYPGRIPAGYTAAGEADVQTQAFFDYYNANGGLASAEYAYYRPEFNCVGLGTGTGATALHLKIDYGAGGRVTLNEFPGDLVFVPFSHPDPLIGQNATTLDYSAAYRTLMKYYVYGTADECGTLTAGYSSMLLVVKQ